MSQYILLDELLTIIDVDSSKYERVARITGQSSGDDLNITLDINSELYPINKDETISLQISSTLTDELRDQADYIMFGKIYRFDEAKGGKTSVLVSFGGLLMRAEGNDRKLSRLSQGDVYLLLRK
ncbi:RNA polymerase II [Protomyces lactucae-debilis]|uniref:RNA polymerase II n=1 Tax=Protomyces lactucae-debilis TaxID=2754530 RepID=A0A1Y2FSN4_PROLT|nr:RNA polymerase II [Protomyces lactucae-debilis]ORY85725.1 RNA polymerase II [Protomyces lactucae-debilis]